MKKITSLVIKNLLFSALLITSGGMTATRTLAINITSAVNAEVTSAFPFVPTVSTSLNFKVNVSNSPPLDPNLRLTGFSAQLIDSITSLDRATFSWTSAPGWRVSSQDNAAGNAYFEVLDPKNGIQPGSFLDGFNTKGLGVDLILLGGIKITSATATAVPWETDALPVVGSTLLFGLGVWTKHKRKSSKSSEKDNTKDF